MTLLDKVISDYNSEGTKVDKKFITTFNCPDTYFKKVKPIKGCHKVLGSGNGILCQRCWGRKFKVGDKVER